MNKMNIKHILLYVFILTSISIVKYFLYTKAGIELPDYTIDFCIFIIVGISCFHHSKKYEFNLAQCITQGIIIGTLSGLISGLFSALMTPRNWASDFESILYNRLIVLLTWIILATLSSVIVSLVLSRFANKKLYNKNAA